MLYDGIYMLYDGIYMPHDGNYMPHDEVIWVKILLSINI